MDASERYRVVYVDHAAVPSGAELALLRLIAGLREEIDPHVILFEDGPLVRMLRAADIPVEVLKTSQGVRRLSATQFGIEWRTLAAAPLTAWYALRLLRRLRELEPDLIHVNSLKAGVIGGLAARGIGVPVIWHLRDRFDNYPIPGWEVTALRQIVKLLSSGVIANSAGTLSTLGHGRQLPLHAVIPSGVSLEPVPPRNDMDFRFGMVGRLCSWKGQDVFIRAFAQVRSQYPCTARVIGDALFGKDDRDYAEKLHKLTEQLGISESVEFRGHREDVRAELAEVDVVIHASTRPEPLGQVVLQGMAAGVPVIAAAAGGPLEIISDHESGLLHNPGDESDLAAKMVELMRDPVLRAKLREAGFATARDYSIDKTAASTYAFYGKVLSGTRPTRPRWFKSPRVTSDELPGDPVGPPA